MPYIGRAPSASIIKIEDADQDTKIQVEESSDEDIIRFDIAGAEDFTMSANTFTASSGSTIAAQALTATTVTATGLVTAGAKIDLNGTELILDADADTSITADTDDTIDIRIAGADDFQFTANTLSVLSGSTLNIDSGATIANSGTATGFNAVHAAAGIMEANANFVDAVIFGPAMDPVDWSGRTAASTASLMLATVEDTGSDTQVNVWDLTSTTIASATPLATLTISGAATVTSVAASMGYIIVGSEDGTTIIDPHSGAWAERTAGWPKSLSTSTTPALTNNSVVAVAAGLHDDWPLDPRTGGTMPCFGISYGAGVDASALIKYDGNVYDKVIPSGSIGFVGVSIGGGRILYNADEGGLNVVNRSPLITTITADDYTDIRALRNDNYPYGFGGENALVSNGKDFMAASAEGVTFSINPSNDGSAGLALNAIINRTFNSGFYTQDVRGAWLANSPTVDRSYKANTLTNNGSAVTAAAVETSAELLGYSGFTADNNLSRASDADWDVIGTGAVVITCWFKDSTQSGTKTLMGFGNSGDTTTFVAYLAAGTIAVNIDGATTQVVPNPAGQWADGVWHQVVIAHHSSVYREIFMDGVLLVTDSTDVGSISDSGNMPLVIGVWPDGSSNPASTTTIALARLSVTIPTATQVRQMYDAEKGMFVASAKCLLQSGSTDAVLDVSVDPITNKVAVTQTDSQMIWNGLVMESAPAVNAGASEHNKLFGGDRVEINSVNLYATIAAKNLRGDLDIVRGMKAGLPAGVDLSKAKAWGFFDISGGSMSIKASYNIKSATYNATGDVRSVTFGVPFKGIFSVAACGSTTRIVGLTNVDGSDAYVPGTAENYIPRVLIYSNANSAVNANFSLVCFGELENE